MTGNTPHWGIERGEHPYINLLSRCPYWMGQDIPWPAENIYDVKQDKLTAKRILSLEQQLAQDKSDFEVLLDLGKLCTLTSMGQQRITSLNKANKLQNNHPEVLKNLAIAHVDAHYQYKTALKLMDKYVKIRPQDSFGHFYRGYLQLMENKPEDAINSFEKGLEQDPDNIYGLSKLARAYLKRNNIKDKQYINEIIYKLEKIAPEHVRLKWLKSDFSYQ
jgi:tetratricopeptide (TPR) repeat protein